MDTVKILNAGCGNHDYGDVRIDTLDWELFDSLKDQIIIRKNLIKASLECIPLKDNSVTEEVFCFHVLEHTRYPYQILLEFKRVITKTAKLQLGLPNASLLSSEHKTHLYSWTPDTITNILRETGFKIIELITPTKASSINMDVTAKCVN